MQGNPKFLMIGGFLGAGKTTTIGRLARMYLDKGLRVAIVTNDQATDLVDTNLLRSQGFDVGEVAGSCFCCNFDELTRTMERLGSDARPDIVIAEPVGSCTDLVATVLRPLQQIYEQPFDVAPYGVIVKPSHGLKILKKVAKGGFSPQAEYIFRKQIEEADFLILNRMDELSAAEADELEDLLQENYPGTPCMRVSAKTGLGFSKFVEQLDAPGIYGTKVMEVDYEIYAEGEAELGWLNAQLELRSDTPFLLDQICLEIVSEIQAELSRRSAEVAHLKVIGMSDGKYSVSNSISNETDPVLSIESNQSCNEAEMVVNARVAVSPEELTEIVTATIARITSNVGISTNMRGIQSFRPGKPVPTHRIH